MGDHRGRARDPPPGVPRVAFAQARARGILDMAAVEAAHTRVEWRASLAVLHDVTDEFTE